MIILRFVYLDVKCFERSLVRRRDSEFFSFGTLCRYIRKLCQRALLPKHTPAYTDWSLGNSVFLDFPVIF